MVLETVAEIVGAENGINTITVRCSRSRKACRAMGVARASVYRRRKPSPSATDDRPRRPQPRALDEVERCQVLDLLHSLQLVDKAPAAVYATLLDEGMYHCSIRTMYRILQENGQVCERRDQLRHPNYKKPELLATASNQVWSWDITKLLGPAKWTYYYLYVISADSAMPRCERRDPSAISARGFRMDVSRSGVPDRRRLPPCRPWSTRRATACRSWAT